MKTRPEDLEVINRYIFPALLGANRFIEKSGPGLHMAYNENAVFQALLSNLRPKCSIEVGTETGVTLALIARHSTRAISIDIDPLVKATLADKFPKVEFITGSSHDALPVLLKRLADEGTSPDFIFIDGDHTAEGVRQDIEHVLTIRPRGQIVVLMHDTFNPGCRKGILSAQWSRNPYCHYVELDFCPGVLHPDESCLRQMWGGLGFALFLPEARQHTIEVKTSHQILFEAAFLQSVYCRKAK
jgi:predicted O-methyltransferase YrrM